MRLPRFSTPRKERVRERRFCTGAAGNAGKPMKIYRVTTPWNENGLTWLKRDSTHAWVAPGGDFAGLGGQPFSVATNSPADGQPVAWNLVTGINDPPERSERAIWVTSSVWVSRVRK